MQKLRRINFISYEKSGMNGRYSAKKMTDGYSLFTSLFICALLFVGGKAEHIHFDQCRTQSLIIDFTSSGIHADPRNIISDDECPFVLIGTIICVVALDGWQQGGLVKIVATISSVGVAFSNLFVGNGLFE